MLLAALAALAAAAAAHGQRLPVMVGQKYGDAVAALRGRGIAFREEPATLPQKKIVYGGAGESVTLEFWMWPAEANAPAAAYEAGSAAPRELLLTRIRDVAPGSDRRRDWVRSFEKEGRHWAYLSPQALAARPAEERRRYPVAAYLQWWRRSGPGTEAVPSVTFLFQAARPAGTKPGSETTQLDIFLENPHRPRHF